MIEAFSAACTLIAAVAGLVATLLNVAERRRSKPHTRSVKGDPS